MKRDTASTSQPIFSTSPVETATTSPAATRRVSAEPSCEALRASSCCTRAAAVIQLVTAARCRKVSPIAVAAPHRAIAPPVRASRVPERSTTASMANPTQNGCAETATKCSSPQARDLSWPPSWLRPSHHRKRGPERASGTPGSGYGRSWICMTSQWLESGVGGGGGRGRRRGGGGGEVAGRRGRTSGKVRGERQQTVQGSRRSVVKINRFSMAAAGSGSCPTRPGCPETAAGARKVVRAWADATWLCAARGSRSDDLRPAARGLVRVRWCGRATRE